MAKLPQHCLELTGLILKIQYSNNYDDSCVKIVITMTVTITRVVSSGIHRGPLNPTPFCARLRHAFT